MLNIGWPEAGAGEFDFNHHRAYRSSLSFNFQVPILTDVVFVRGVASFYDTPTVDLPLIVVALYRNIQCHPKQSHRIPLDHKTAPALNSLNISMAVECFKPFNYI